MMPSFSEVLYLSFITLAIAFSVGFSFIVVATSIRFGLSLLYDGCCKIIEKIKKSD